MTRLFLLWSADPADSGGWISGDGGRCVVFDPLGQDLAERRGLAPVVADDLLDWTTRAEIEDRVRRLLDALRNDAVVGPHRVSGRSLVDAAEYELRFEWTALLCAYEAVRSLPAQGGAPTVCAQPGTPSSVLAGAAAALGADGPTAGTWVPVLAQPPARRLGHLAVDAVVAARASVTRRDSVRVLALPAQRMIVALGSLEREQLTAAGIAVGVFPGLTHGDPLRLIARKRLPAFFPGARPAPAGPSPRPGSLGERPELDAALREAADRVLVATGPRVAAAAAAIESMEELAGLKALVLPTAALGVARLVCDWAADREVRVAVIQHGIYGFRDWDGGDRLADVILGWGPGVARQVACWPPPRPRVAVVGTPGLSDSGAPAHGATALRRVLVAGTHPNLGSALTPWGFRWEFLRALRPGLIALRDAGCQIALRPHPSEPHAVYAAIVDALDLAPITLNSDGTFADAARRSDLVVCPPSSTAVESAALGAPVLLWMGAIPPDVRRRFLVPPLSDELPASFSTERQFEQLARLGVERPAALLAEATELSRRLTPYAEAFDPDRLAAELLALGE